MKKYWFKTCFGWRYVIAKNRQHAIYSAGLSYHLGNLLTLDNFISWVYLSENLTHSL